MAKSLTACFVGLGSIGKRHLTNLVSLCAERGISLSVDALRHAPTPLGTEIETLLRAQYYNPAELPHYDLLFICNPSQQHYETLCRLKGNADRFFVEKPLFVKPLTDAQLAPFDDSAKYYVACPMRHTKVFDFLQKFVKEHPVYSARAICSSYLPEWRPNQDYRKLYSAAKESGGVKLDLIHEFDYLFSLFGFPKQSFLSEGKFSTLEISSSDTVAFIGEYEDMVVELHLDYHGRSPQRYIELYTQDDVVHCDFLRSEVRFLKSGQVISFAEERTEYCRRELAYFLDFAGNGLANINAPRYANLILHIIWGA